MPATKKYKHTSAVGSNLTGQRGGGICHTGPLIILWLLSLSRVRASSNCTECIKTTLSGHLTMQTLICHTHYQCSGTPLEMCTHNNTEYAKCNIKDKIIYYDPKMKAKECGKWAGGCGNMEWIQTYSCNWKYTCSSWKYKSKWANTDCTRNWNYCSSWTCVLWTTDYSPGEYTKRLEELGYWVVKLETDCLKRILQIGTTGSDPGTLVHIKIQEHEMETGAKYEIPTIARNLFVNLAENIAKVLNINNCYVCGGTNMGEQWPWEPKKISITDNSIWNSSKVQRAKQWALQTSIIGQNCWQKPPGRQGRKPVGDLICENNIAEGGKSWTLNKNTGDKWEAPEGLYWICGKYAYSELPRNWTRTCVLGTIRPSFFLLPICRGQQLGVPVYSDVSEIPRAKRGLQIGNWKDDQWPPERIIAYYNPASWAEDGSWGYQVPIYMLNRIIRLQAVLETVTNKTGDALTILAKQNSKTRTVVYQNRLALDYLLAQEGGVGGKFNLSNCCLQIDDEGKAIEKIITEMKKVTHVPVQTWRGFNLDIEKWWNNNWWNFGGLRGILLNFVLLITGLLVIPCVVPLISRKVRKTIEQLRFEIITPEGAESKIRMLKIWSRDDPFEEAKLIFERNERIRKARNENYGSSQMG
uniref:Uncharacterized protein n=1 Tax=Melopsittacus undulatus TaxID=13146 RepID=A0A8V5GW00_MELUD